MITLVESGVKQDPKRIISTPFWYDEPTGLSRKGSDVHRSAICWVNCVKVLMYSYLNVSSNDPDGEDCCTMDGALPQINVVESYARLDSKAVSSLRIRLDEAENTIRHEWRRAMQQGREISLDDAIEMSLIHTYPYYFCAFLLLLRFDSLINYRS